MNKEDIITIAERFGYKVYNEGNKQYFLQSRSQIKPTYKVSMEEMAKKFEIEKSEPSITKKVTKKVKGVVKDE